MLNILIQKSTDYLINHNVIDADDRDIYEYGFHSLYSNIIIFFVIGTISIVIKQFPQTVIYHISFILMRNNAGGYHAKTQVRCFFMSTLLWILALLVISNISSSSIIICLTLLSTIIVWLKAPIEHENNPMSRKKFIRMKNRSRVFSCTLLLIIILICRISSLYIWVASSLAIGMFSHAMLIILALYASKHSHRISK